MKRYNPADLRNRTETAKNNLENATRLANQISQTNLDHQMNEARGQYHNLSYTLNSLHSELYRLESEITQYQTSIEQDRNNSNVLRSNIEQNAREIATLKNDIVVIKTKTSELKAKQELMMRSMEVIKLQKAQVGVEHAAAKKTEGELLDLLTRVKEVLATYRHTEAIEIKTTPADLLPAKELISTQTLQRAIEHGQISDFLKLLSTISAEDINYQYKDGSTILIQCAQNAFYQGIGAMLQRGNLDADIRDHKDINALIYFAYNPEIRTFRALADHTTDLNHRWKDGVSAMYALVLGTYNVIFGSDLNEIGPTKDGNRFILECKMLHDPEQVFNRGNADMRIFPVAFRDNDSYACTSDFTSSSGCTFSFGRAEGFTHNQEKVLRLLNYLVTKGGDINLQDSKGQTPFMLACRQYEQGGIHLAREIMKIPTFTTGSHDVFGFDEMLRCMELNDIPTLQALYNTGFDISKSVDKLGRTPLHWAVWNQNPGLINFFLSIGFDPHQPHKDGITPLHIIVHRDQNHAQMLDVFNSRGVDMHRKNSYGLNILHIAAAHNKVNVMEWCLSHGFSIDEKDEYGSSEVYYSTAIGWAADYGALDALKFCIANGTKIDDQGCNNGNTALGITLQANRVITAKYLIDLGASLTAVDNDGDTILHYASGNNEFVYIIGLALAANVPVDVRNKKGETPLISAAKKGVIEAAEVLLTKGANVLGCDNTGMSPIHYAAFGGHFGFVKKLIELYPYLINLESASQSVPLFYALQHFNTEQIEWLISRIGNESKVKEILDSKGCAAIRSWLIQKDINSEARQTMVKLLLEHNANTHDIDEDHHSALELAREHAPDCVSMLEEYEQQLLGCE